MSTDGLEVTWGTRLDWVFCRPLVLERLPTITLLRDVFSTNAIYSFNKCQSTFLKLKMWPCYLLVLWFPGRSPWALALRLEATLEPGSNQPAPCFLSGPPPQGWRSQQAVPRQRMWSSCAACSPQGTSTPHLHPRPGGKTTARQASLLPSYSLQVIYWRCVV